MSYHSNTSYPYTTSYGYSYQGYPNPAEPQYASTTTSSYPSSSSLYPSYSSAYVTSAAMIPNTSQDSHTSSSSANSRYSSNTYASSYGTSPSSPQSPMAFGHQQQQQQQQSSYPAPSSRSHYVPLASSQPIPPPPGHETIKPSSSSDKNKKPTPFICLHAGCPRQFARSYDLDRHLKTHFPAAAPRFDCPKGLAGAWCGRVGDRGFTRQDHLNEHLRKVHLVDLPKSARGSRESRG